MVLSDMTSRQRSEQRKLDKTRDKFEQLLNADPASPAFERLFYEVDELLAGLIRDEAFDEARVPGTTGDGTLASTPVSATLTKGS